MNSTLIALGVIFLIILILILSWISNRKLRKIKEAYKDEENKSRPSEKFRQEFRRDTGGSRRSEESGTANGDTTGLIGGVGEFEKSEYNSKPISIAERNSLLQDASTIEHGISEQNSNGNQRDDKEDWPSFS